jgi:hypothetical protein
MWILQWLPDWFFYAAFLGGVGAFVASYFIPLYKSIIQLVSALIIVLSAYMCGGIADNKEWLDKTKELEIKVALAEAQSAKETVKIVNKVVKQKEVITQKGDDIIHYIDKEVVKYDNTCVLPKEFIEAINKATE